MAFRKLERSSQTPPGWRLATVKEAMENLELIKHNHLLEEWDRVRLLDGWIGGRGYDFNVEVGFRSCLGYMLLVQSPTPEISNADDRKAILYSTVPKLGKEGRNAAVFLCAEDWNEEILYSLMPGEYYATREGDETRLTSEVVSAMAREWQGVFNARNRALKMELVPLTSLEDLRISIEESLKALVVDTEKALSSLIIKNQSSERGTIANDILKELFSLISQFDLTEYFKMFEDIGQHVVAETVWSVVVETMASETFYILCSQLNRNVVIDSDPSLTDLVQYSYAFLGETQREVRKVVEAAAREADGDFKRFEDILRDQWFPMLSCRSKPDALSTCLLRAAYHGDVNMVKELIELGVQPSAKDVVSGDSGETALHFAVNHGDRYTEDESFKIADMLLAKDRSLANAVDWEERTPLHQAASHGDARMCTLLLEHNASLSAKDAKGWTPLHHALSVSSYHEVVRVLLSEEGKDSIEGSARLVDAANNDGETPLDYAIANTDNDVSLVALLLSESSQAESYFEMLRQPLSAYLRESSRMGYENLVQKLVDGGGDPFEEDDQGKCPLHYAAEGTNEHVAFGIIQKLLFDKKQGTVNWGKASAGDKYGRNVLHVAAFLGNKSLCSELLRVNSNLIATKDRDGQSAIYYAVAGDHDNPHVFDELISSEGDRTNVVSIKDFSQTTLLHVAATAGNRKMVKRLLSGISRQDRKSYVGAPDVLGQTALHKAATGGHWKTVKMLLECGADSLKERDCDGKTALCFAAQADGEVAVKVAELLLESCKSDKQKSLLLLASAVGIGMRFNSSLEEYLKQKKIKIQETVGPEHNLLRVAATLGDIDMTLECVTRGANISLICNDQWIASLETDEKKNVQDVLKKIKIIVDQGTDKPALEDNLGRSPFAIGLAALFLNPFVKSPITVGISGEWGMGKSSVMLQTEMNLLKAAAQLAFSKLFQKNSFPRLGESELSITGHRRRKKIANAIEKLVKKFTTKATNFWIFPNFRKLWKAPWNKYAASQDLSKFNDFLENYQTKYHQIFKCLAIMDRSDMFEEEEEIRFGKQAVGEMSWEEDLMQGITPSILTVQYNAWQYRNETEAWAGLAVEITKELEATMTVAHKLRTSWIYNWRNRRNSICFGVILPFFLALVVAMWFSTIVWFVLDSGKDKDIKKFKYAGLPASIIVAAWGLGKSVFSFVKPVSSQVVDYLCLPDHSQKLGYHQKVIDDINFLKEHLCYKRGRKWEVFAFIWCCITWSWNDNYVAGTKICKMPPAYGNKLRMIVFVDDLDRCEENVILQVLSAVNLVLATCEINVILSMENTMIQRAILRKYGDKNSKDNKELAEKYLRKIVQLPLQLPDPSDSESSDFLERQLGMWEGSIDPAAEIEKINAHDRRRKESPKFEIIHPAREKFKRGREGEESFAQSGAKLKRDPANSDATTETNETTDNEQPVDEKRAEDSGVEEGTTVIDMTTDIEHPIKRNKQEEKNEKAERTSTITQIYSYGCALLCPCNVRPHNTHSKVEVTTGINETTRIEEPIEGNEQGDQQQRQGSEGKRLMDDLSSIMSALLIPRYTPGERSAFRFLHSRSTRSRKLPREWKCLMAYHRLAWNILFLTPECIRVEGWQVQLIAWIFVCWEWRDLITVLIKNWNKLDVLRNWKGQEGPSLREVVEHYIDEALPADKKSATKEKDDSTKEVKELASGNLQEENFAAISSEEDTRGDDYLRKILKEQEEMREALTKVLKEQEEMREILMRVLKEQEEMKEIRNMLEMVKEKVFKEDVEDNKEESSLQQGQGQEDMERESSVQQYTTAEEREEWIKLRDTLRLYNVSMNGIQAFQKFRFYCEPRYLPWPLPRLV